MQSDRLSAPDAPNRQSINERKASKVQFLSGIALTGFFQTKIFLCSRRSSFHLYIDLSLQDSGQEKFSRPEWMIVQNAAKTDIDFRQIMKACFRVK